MYRSRGFPGLWLGCVMLASSAVSARPVAEPAVLEDQQARAADFHRPASNVGVLQDTTWIADWSFDGPDSTCNDSGWIVQDGFVRDDGSNYWSIGTHYAGQGHIQNRAAELRRHDVCWARDGYGNDWDYSIRLRYRGTGSTLSFDFLSDSEPGFDFVTIEADSACSADACSAATGPPFEPELCRLQLFLADGLHLNGQVTGLPLPDFGLPGSEHCVLIRFSSDGAYSDQDGLYPSAIGAGLVVDNIVVTGGLAYSENFEGPALDPNVTLENSAPKVPSRLLARLEHHPPDFDPAAEDSTCAWVFTDPTFLCQPFNVPCVPGDNSNTIVSPPVTLFGGDGMVLSYRVWRSQVFNWCTVWTAEVRAALRKDNTDTPAPGDSVDCFGSWSSTGLHIPNSNQWTTVVEDLSSRIPAGAVALQVRFVVAPWGWISGGTTTCSTSPGPYFDRVRVGQLRSPTDSPPEGGAPRVAVLHPNVPNPFNPTTTIRFDLGEAGRVQLSIFDVAGRHVRTLMDKSMAPREGHTVLWNGADDSGRPMPSGVYVIRLVTSGSTTARRAVLLR